MIQRTNAGVASTDKLAVWTQRYQTTTRSRTITLTRLQYRNVCYSSLTQYRKKTTQTRPPQNTIAVVLVGNRTLLRTSIAMGVPKVKPSGERPDRISTWSSSFLGVVMRDCPGFRRSSSAQVYREMRADSRG